MSDISNIIAALPLISKDQSGKWNYFNYRMVLKAIAYLLGLYFTQEEINQLPNEILFNKIKPELDELLSMILVDYNDDKLITLKQLDTMGKLTSPMPRFTKSHKKF